MLHRLIWLLLAWLCAGEEPSAAHADCVFRERHGFIRAHIPADSDSRASEEGASKRPNGSSACSWSIEAPVNQTVRLEVVSIAQGSRLLVRFHDWEGEVTERAVLSGNGTAKLLWRVAPQIGATQTLEVFFDWSDKGDSPLPQEDRHNGTETSAVPPTHTLMHTHTTPTIPLTHSQQRSKHTHTDTLTHSHIHADNNPDLSHTHQAPPPAHVTPIPAHTPHPTQIHTRVHTHTPSQPDLQRTHSHTPSLTEAELNQNVSTQTHSSINGAHTHIHTLPQTSSHTHPNTVQENTHTLTLPQTSADTHSSSHTEGFCGDALSHSEGRSPRSISRRLGVAMKTTPTWTGRRGISKLVTPPLVSPANNDITGSQSVPDRTSQTPDSDMTNRPGAATSGQPGISNSTQSTSILSTPDITNHTPISEDPDITNHTPISNAGPTSQDSRHSKTDHTLTVTDTHTATETDTHTLMDTNTHATNTPNDTESTLNTHTTDFVTHTPPTHTTNLPDQHTPHLTHTPPTHTTNLPDQHTPHLTHTPPTNTTNLPDQHTPHLTHTHTTNTRVSDSPHTHTLDPVGTHTSHTHTTNTRVSDSPHTHTLDPVETHTSHTHTTAAPQTCSGHTPQTVTAHTHMHTADTDDATLSPLSSSSLSPLFPSLSTSLAPVFPSLSTSLSTLRSKPNSHEPSVTPDQSFGVVTTVTTPPSGTFRMHTPSPPHLGSEDTPTNGPNQSDDSGITKSPAHSTTHTQTETHINTLTQTDAQTETHTHTNTLTHTDPQTDNTIPVSTHTHIPANTNTQGQTERDTHTQTETHANTHTQTETHANTHTQTETHANTLTQTETHANTHTQTERHANTHTQTETHANTHTHASSSSLPSSPSDSIHTLLPHTHTSAPPTDTHTHTPSPRPPPSSAPPDWLHRGRIFIEEDQPPIVKVESFQLLLQVLMEENCSQVEGSTTWMEPFLQRVTGYQKHHLIWSSGCVLQSVVMFHTAPALSWMRGAESLLQEAGFAQALVEGLNVQGVHVKNITVGGLQGSTCDWLLECKAGFECVSIGRNFTCRSACHAPFCHNNGICVHHRGQQPSCRCPVGVDFWFMGQRCDVLMTRQRLVGVCFAVVVAIATAMALLCYLVIRRFKTLLIQAKVDQTRSSYRRFNHFDELSARYWSRSLAESGDSLDNPAFSRSDELLHLRARQRTCCYHDDTLSVCSTWQGSAIQLNTIYSSQYGWDVSNYSLADAVVDSGKASDLSVCSWPIEPIQWTPFPLLQQLHTQNTVRSSRPRSYCEGMELVDLERTWST